ncbi:gastrula zinc finger protein XlCGF48.2-like [Hyla sarda]|uniref:gastrula zinc finger protein XlCGF48.2-like n=1 Tax=Hyla sarda TaxID=327740 RepID=UPI0024C4679D|nr:gastrula zinc finger protein XlCGF48.2-like [Hyla sarda]XP_056387566.1 gastrula zinc finger protein XlCGF48.2-like [Hyla sarda]XP_056387567.1 gastrula zinc finger protein XlCGF48.2-like [Hyla sarda]
MKLSPLDDLTKSLSMDKARNHLIEKIMHITLDILYLLTGEDYIVLKMSGGRVTHSSSPIVSGGFCRNQSSNIDPQVNPMREERKNDEKILELTNTIAQLLTEEVPIRCQDVTVYFSMEECDDLEKSNAPTKDGMSEEKKHIAFTDGSKNKELIKNFTPANSEDEVLSKIPRSTLGTQTLTVKEEENFDMVDEEAIPKHSSYSTGTSSNRSTPEKHHCPPSPEDSLEDDGNIMQDEQWEDFDDLKIETKSLEDEEKISKWNDVPSKEECISKKWKRGWLCKKSVTEEFKKPYQQQNEIDRGPEERRDLPHRAKCLLPSVIEVDEEEIGSLQRTAEWEIHEDGSTHLMTSGGILDTTRKYSLASRITPDPKTAHPAVHLESPQKVHSIPTECGKSFTTSLQLGPHIKVHTEEKLFACSECGKCFTVKSNLLAHKAIHMGEKPFACADCGRRFTLKSSLDTHMSVHALEKPYACSICGKCFTSKARLAFHQTTHIGEKTYECDECGKVFTASGSLNRHKRTHTGEKPYACRICGKCFNRETNLYRHQIIHTR